MPASVAIDASEIRRLVQTAKDRGLIRAPGVAVAVDKNGQAAARSGDLRSQWMEIDVPTARRWLENNFRNRPLVQDVVQAYARDMACGTWVATHQGIAFNDRDELIDGQHRLHAIVRSGCTVRMMVTFGLPSVIEGSEMTTMDAVDRGRTRSVADQLKIQHGLANGSVIAAMCASLGAICHGERTRRLSVGQTLEIYRAFQSPMDWIIERRPKTPGLRVTGMLAGFAFAMAAQPEDGIICRQFERLVGGGELPFRSPIGLLREFLLSDEAKLLTRGTDRGVAELTLQAIWLECAGREVAKLEMSLDGVEAFRRLQHERVATIGGIFALPAGCN